MADGSHLPDQRRTRLDISSIIPSDGGQPEQLDFGTENAHCPVWSPDGSAIAFVAQDAKTGEYDFWAVNARGSREELPRRLGAQAQLRSLNLPAISSYNDCPQDWMDGRLLFITHERDTSFLFQAALQPSGRLGEIRAVPASIGAAGARFIRGPARQLSVLFAPERRETNIWGYDLYSARPPQQLTRDTSVRPGWNGTWPALSGDGNVLAFVTARRGSSDICVKDLHMGTEQLLAVSPFAQSPLFLDRTGSRIVFVRKQGSVISIMLRKLAEKRDRLLTTNCPILQDWSSDGELLLCSAGTDLFQIRIGESRQKTLLHLPREPELARFSPDGRWVAFVSTTGQGENIAGYLAPLDGSNRTIQLDQEVYTLSLHWSPDGNAIYYWSVRDGFRCLYKQSLDPRTKIPRGVPVAILHRHELQHYPWSGGTLAVGSGRVAMTLTDELANIWKVTLPR